jgi:hypothetical protein
VAEEEYASWSELSSNCSMDDQEGRIEAVADELERNLRLLGAIVCLGILQKNKSLRIP